MYATKDTGIAKATKQVDKFKQAARELGADDSEKRFNERLGKIAKRKPPAPVKKSNSLLEVQRLLQRCQFLAGRLVAAVLTCN
jgi:hypothetical protein